MSEGVVHDKPWSRGRNGAVVAMVAVLIGAVFIGVVWWVISLFPGPNYRVQPAPKQGGPVRTVVITSDDDLTGSDYQRITASMWGRYGPVRIVWQCGNGSFRGRSTQSDAGNFVGSQTGVGC